MSVIIHNNKFEDNIASTSHTVSSSSVTADTPLDNIFDRSVVKRYDFTSGSTSLTHTLTINLTDAVSATRFYMPSFIHQNLTSFFVPTIKLYDSSLALLTSVNTPLITTVRTINGEYYRNFIYSFDESDIKRVELSFTNSTSLSSYIGLVYLGEHLDLNVSPSSVNYSFGSQGNKQRTQGGQVIAGTTNAYMKASFRTTVKKESEQVSDYFNLNYNSSTGKPIVFIPNESPADANNAILLYGTQERLNSSKMVVGKKDNEWLYETQFSIEEEL
ncbi:MAG: hypothetical protein OQK29_06620 [Ignavibacteriaceae bacterium]|nr:hypothetical protein [Ignavibacteriaceae bacterium]